MSARMIMMQGQHSAPPLWQRALLPTLILGGLTSVAYAPDLAAKADPVAIEPATTADPAEAVNFDSSFFSTETSAKVDLSRFEKGNVALPGTYFSDVRVNNAWQARADLVFTDVPGLTGAQPCFDPAMLTQFGVDLKKVAATTENPPRKAMPSGQFCGLLGDYVPGATASFDVGRQELSLLVPQIYINAAARGYVDPSQWDAGINAAVLGYNTNLYRSMSGRQDQTHAYVGLNASMKLGSWHAYTLGSLSWNEGSGKRYQNTASYLQHDIPSLKAQFVAGDTFTAGTLFDSVRLRGVRLYSDDRMLPQSLRGYAPIVRGTAQTNAHVVIRQRGYIIYDANVAPGPFSIDDLYPTGYGGDLDVEVIEADGRTQRFSVPFSATAQLLRPGQNRWDVSAGKIQQVNLLDAPYVVQATFQRGLNNVVTGYAGGTVANGYAAALAGAAFNTSVGAFSSDLTGASNHVPGQRKTHGTSVRLGYNKNITDTGTNFALAAYRYSTSGYASLNDAVILRDAAMRYGGSALVHQRSRIDLNISQSFGDRYGQLFLSGSVTNYWGGNGRQVNFSTGYSNHWKSLTYGVSAQRLLEGTYNFTPGSGPLDQIPGIPGAYTVQVPGQRDTRIMFTMSVPLGRNDRAPQLSAMINRAKSGGNSNQATLSGSLGADRRFSYGATIGQTDGNEHTLSVNGQYVSPLAQIAAGYSQGSAYKQVNASASGGVVVHAGGVTLSPPLGETIGLVHAPDAAGAGVSNGQGSKVDSHGYAVVPNLMPYQLNTVAIDPKGIDAGVELKSTTANVAPRAGSVVRLRYETTSGRALIVETSRPDGQPVPFGAEVFDALGNSVGVVGQGSRLYVRDMPPSGELTVKWGESATESCRINVQAPPTVKGQKSTLQTVQAACQTDNDPMAHQLQTATPDPAAVFRDTSSHASGQEGPP